MLLSVEVRLFPCQVCRLLRWLLLPIISPIDISQHLATSGRSRTFFGRGGAKCSGLKSHSLNRRSQRSPLVDLGKHAANAWRCLKIRFWEVARHLLLGKSWWCCRSMPVTISCKAVGHWIASHILWVSGPLRETSWPMWLGWRLVISCCLK